MLELIFLGTSSGVPTRRRNVSALAVQTGPGRSWLLVDCGEATQHQLLRTRLSVHDLEAVLITHAHGDHCYGLPGLLASCAMHGRTQPLWLVAPQAVLDWVEATRQCGDLHLPFALQARALQPGMTVLDRPGLVVSAHGLEHRVPSVAFRMERTVEVARLDVAALRRLGVPQGPLWGQLQRGETVMWQGQCVPGPEVLHHSVQRVCAVVAGDNATPAVLAGACQGAQLLVHESTYTQEVLRKVGPQYMHSCAAEVAQFAAQAGVPNLVLTHFSPRYDSMPDGMAQLRAEAQAQYSGTLYLAQDFDHYRLHADGLLQPVAGRAADLVTGPLTDRDRNPCA